MKWFKIILIYENEYFEPKLQNNTLNSANGVILMNLFLTSQNKTAATEIFVQ